MTRLMIFAAFGLVACSSTAERSHVLLMQKIEEKVQLPKGAKKLERYDRYYAGSENRIIGVYINIDMILNRQSASPVGESRWLNDQHDLPNFSDGGCSIVNVVYDPETQRVQKIFCHGLA